MNRQFGFLIAAFCLVASPAFAQVPVSFEDVNCNGVMDSGDKDITKDLAPGEWATWYSSPNCVVVPKGVAVAGRKGGGVYLFAGKGATINGNIITDSYATVFVQAQQGDIIVGPRALLIGVSHVLVSADVGSVFVGPGAVLSATGSSGNTGAVAVSAGSKITFGAKARIAASDGGIDINADGPIITEPLALFTTAKGSLRLVAGTGLNAAQLSITAHSADIAGKPVNMTRSTIRVPSGGCTISGGGTLPTLTDSSTKGCIVTK